VHARNGATKGHKSTKVSTDLLSFCAFCGYLPWKFLRTNLTMSAISACDILSLNAGIASSPFVIIFAI